MADNDYTYSQAFRIQWVARVETKAGDGGNKERWRRQRKKMKEERRDGIVMEGKEGSGGSSRDAKENMENRKSRRTIIESSHT